MPTPRDLTTADIASVLGLQSEAAGATAVFDAVTRLVHETVGPYRLLTVLRYREAEEVVERVYSSDPAYPIGGRKPLALFPTNHAAMARGDIFLAGTRAEVEAAFADHATLFGMGITAILNAPIRHAGCRLGTLNLCGEDGQFGPREIANARLLAALLAPTLLTLPMRLSS